ncbi:hypothetical protein [Kitasatospora sp. MBT63]|uniref:hypothetical protein n=1 Tax=Kitasatospora sp. MBT63 TaxID=1444768 RepID=UPI0011EA6123|nr:hypothetical protein [Kitasatospora sp. MBT63]
MPSTGPRSAVRPSVSRTRITPSRHPGPVPAAIHGHPGPVEEQRSAYCDRHMWAVPPCGQRTSLLVDQPALLKVPKAIDGAGLPPVTVPAWMTADPEGISLREQLAARGRERELAGSR